MFAACALVSVLLFVPTQDRYAPLRGLTVGSVDVHGTSEAEASHLRELIAIPLGEPLSQQVVQRAVGRLYALGRFSQVRVWADAHLPTVDLQFDLQPVRRLEALVVTHARAIDTTAFRAALGLNTGDEVDSRTQDTLRRRALQHLKRVGYPLAQLDVHSQPGSDPSLVTCTLRVDAGPAVHVTGVQFAGTPRLPAPLLRDQIAVRQGHVLDQDVLEADQARLKQTYIDRGYLRAQVRAPWVKHDPFGAEVVFHVEAGPRIVVRYRGNHALNDSALQALWPEPTGALTASTLEILRQRIEQAYTKLSYVGTQVRVHRLPGILGRTEHYIMAVQEGQPVRVSHVEFTGVQAFSPELFVDQIRALLARELESQTFFEPLGAAGQVLSTAPQQPLAAAATFVPAQERWVPAIYLQAADEVAAAYRDVGYLKVTVQTPTLVPDPNLSNRTPQVACAHLPGMMRQPTSRTCDVWAQMQVEQGPQSFIESILFTGNQSIHADVLLAQVYAATANRSLSAPLLPGAPLSQSGVEDGRIQMIRHYRDQGYLYVRIFANVAMAADGVWAKVHYTVEEGPQVRIERILLRGNQHTRDGVVRSRMAMRPGDLYRLDQAVSDQRSIAALGTFSTVRVKLIDEERPAQTKDLVAEVVERPRQPIEVVPGISTTNGPRLRLSYSHINVGGTASAFTASLKVNRQIFFFLFGDYADNLSNRYASYTGIEQITKAIEREGRLGLRSPPIKFLPFDPLLRLDLVDLRINAVRYSLDSTIAIFGTDMVLPWRIKPSVELQVGLTNLECPLGDACSQNLDVRHLQGGRPIQEGEIRSLKFGPQLIVDRRDNALTPRRGFFISGRVTQDFGQARPLNTFVPFSFTKYEGNLTGYLPLWKAVVAMSARAGTIHLERSSVPVDERFFLGGRDSLRGFVESTLIPQDACVVANPDGPLPAHCAEGIASTPSPPLSLGGNTFMTLKTELRLPIRANVSLDLFVDIGNLWVDFANSGTFAVRVGTGVGLRYATPVGALAIDFGINPAPRAMNAEPTSQVHFSIGSF